MKLPLIKSKPRVSDEHGPGLWIGASHRVAGPTHEVVETPLGDEVENRPPQYLLALWKPLRRRQPFPRRFPAFAALVVCEEADVVDALLKRVPDGARLSVPSFDVDWGLVAQIVMVTDDGLGAAQHQLLQAFIDAERRRTLTTIGTAYASGTAGFQRFADTQPTYPERDE
ncbi:MAG: hypothetical protein MUC74_01480 [Ideonella sp.]|nr:hypothetical protein [Ideonella sp.]